ncbi:hypothetical protein DRN98_07805 [Methanosarcinales archaeon]|nr:MAG: hypothetical protein DRN98_07805 [Methanosarcinales archaeon]
MARQSIYRTTGRHLLDTIDNWENLIDFKVNLIACGGTALTLLEIKESTKDIDMIVPVQKEHERLMVFLRSIGYQQKGNGLIHPDDPNFLYQFWTGSRVFTTQLLDSPLEPDRNIPIKQWGHIYLGALNPQDLIITKMFRGTQVDLDDSVAAFSKFQMDPTALLERYAETAKYDLNPKKMIANFILFAETLVENSMVHKDFIKKAAAYK